jgi:hypothetical protein
MISMGYKLSMTDLTLFIKHSAARKVSILVVYVDDIIVIGMIWKSKNI